MGISTSDFITMQERVLRNRKTEAAQIPHGAVSHEMDLHEQIINYCDSRFPRWKFIRARSDQKSTIAVGAQDFTIFLPGGRTVCIECKSATAKFSTQQLAWRKEMEMLGHIVHVVQAMDQFLQLVEPIERTPIKNLAQPKLGEDE